MIRDFGERDSVFRWPMKKKIHPKYVDATVTCGCGETFNTRSTKAAITVEICSKCHPFYTGKQKFVDSAGQVEKFQKKFGWTEGKVKEVEKRKGPKKAPAMPPPPQTPPEGPSRRPRKRRRRKANPPLPKRLRRRRRKPKSPPARRPPNLLPPKGKEKDSLANPPNRSLDVWRIPPSSGTLSRIEGGRFSRRR
jgi:large subunit ribosomal protein L31